MADTAEPAENSQSADTAASAENPASAFAHALLAELVTRGVRDVVVSPGSRSQALALAAARFERAGLLEVHVRVDERVGGFTALGLARESGAPVAIIVTSGTAVAELHPAALEAAHSGVPLLLLTADRPPELRGIAANQTTVQPGLFGSALPPTVEGATPADGDDHAARAAELADRVFALLPGAVHVDLPFRDPLSGEAAMPDPTPGIWEPAAAEGETLALDAHPGTVVIAGADAGPRAEEVARALGAPLLAEISSGARFGPNLVPAYRELLTTAGFGDRVERAVVFGHPTLSREVPALLARPGVETIVVRAPGVEAYDPARSARVVAAVEVPEGEPQEARPWVGRWVFASRELLAEDEHAAASLDDDYVERARFARAQLEHNRQPVTRRMLVEALWSASWPHDRLVLGSSRLVRVLDRVARGKKLGVHANRGLAGIDGTIATGFGAARAAQRAGATGVTRVLLGDLAFQHDLGSLAPVAGETAPRVQLIVGDDGGGTIFDGLEVADSAEPELFDRVMYTPHALDIEAIAGAFGWEYRRVATRGDLDPALTSGADRLLVHVILER